ncbi:RusA family crossover junction endodeoxyribonuclease, partial [Nostoc sp. UCD120]|uniref:RusA family crossover junction endodeoxyribonuclease n=2 Tax=unclassified Nostoc TaxID=2593658 RepID=UPI001628249C
MAHSEWDKNRELLAQGHITLCLPIEPVSLQASRRRKEVLISEIRKITDNWNFLLVGDVQIDIEWLIHEQKRYESDSSADVDNIVKPILDAISGPKGILVNDCQVQAISCRWIDWDSEEQQITVRIQMFSNDEWLLKQGLVFVHMGKGLCYPAIVEETGQEYTLMIIENLEQKLIIRENIMAKGASYYHAQQIMSVQRIFHISRVQEFHVIELAE